MQPLAAGYSNTGPQVQVPDSRVLRIKLGEGDLTLIACMKQTTSGAEEKIGMSDGG